MAPLDAPTEVAAAGAAGPLAPPRALGVGADQAYAGRRRGLVPGVDGPMAEERRLARVGLIRAALLGLVAPAPLAPPAAVAADDLA